MLEKEREEEGNRKGENHTLLKYIMTNINDASSINGTVGKLYYVTDHVV